MHACPIHRHACMPNLPTDQLCKCSRCNNCPEKVCSNLKPFIWAIEWRQCCTNPDGCVAIDAGRRMIATPANKNISNMCWQALPKQSLDNRHHDFLQDSECSLICRITQRRLLKLRRLQLECRKITFAANWTSGNVLRYFLLRCKNLCLDPKWVPGKAFSYDLEVGPIRTSEVGPMEQMLKSWEGVNLEVVQVLNSLDQNRIVKAKK